MRTPFLSGLRCVSPTLLKILAPMYRTVQSRCECDHWGALASSCYTCSSPRGACNYYSHSYETQRRQYKPHSSGSVGSISPFLTQVLRPRTSIACGTRLRSTWGITTRFGMFSYFLSQESGLKRDGAFLSALEQTCGCIPLALSSCVSCVHASDYCTSKHAVNRLVESLPWFIVL
jgi:hypothetical protein